MKWESHKMILSAPIDRYDEAIPLGNGLLGSLLWGKNNLVRLSLDRGDLWDLRRPKEFKEKQWNWHTMKKLVAEKAKDGLTDIFEKPYSEYPYPTKIPAGRIELIFDKDITVDLFSLDLERAVGCAELGSSRVEVFCNATGRIGIVRITGQEPEIEILSPFDGTMLSPSNRPMGLGFLSKLRYEKPEIKTDENIKWYLQPYGEDSNYAVVVGMREEGRSNLLVYSITTTKDCPDPVSLGRQLVGQGLEAGYESLLSSHVKWWREFWSRSSIKIPDPEVERQYYLAQYFYGAGSRIGSPPIALQGIWTADDGELPPWKGDYHNDLNTEMTYWAYLASGHFDEGLCFLEFMWDLLPTFCDYAKEFYGTSGACIPGVMSLDGKAMGGWHQYSYSPVNSAWVAFAFYLHWKYTQNREFIESRAYPFCEKIAKCLEELLEPDVDGRLNLPLSSSPEIHNNSLEAWLTPNTNYDLSLLRKLFECLIEMAGVIEDGVAGQHWKGLLVKLDDLAVTKVDIAGQSGVGALMLSPDECLQESHRHFSHLLGIYPLGILNIENSKRDQEIIFNSLQQIENFGTQWWVGYSSSWMACILARCCEAEKCLKMLELFLKGFVSRNGFHLNGDYKKLGITKHQGRCFTLDGNMAAAQAVHEMLLQSWGGVIRVFPSVPTCWDKISFRNLRAEGAYKVSAKRNKGCASWVSVSAGCDGVLRLRDPFGGLRVVWNKVEPDRDGEDYVCFLKKGEILEGTKVEVI